MLTADGNQDQRLDDLFGLSLKKYGDMEEETNGISNDRRGPCLGNA